MKIVKTDNVPGPALAGDGHTMAVAVFEAFFSVEISIRFFNPMARGSSQLSLLFYRRLLKWKSSLNFGEDFINNGKFGI